MTILASVPFSVSISISLLIATSSAATSDEKDHGAASKEAITRLAIMGLSAAGLPEEYAVGLTETIATQASDTRVFETISPRQIASLLAYEKRRELLGGCVEEECYIQVAKVIKADHLIAGSVAKVGDRLSLNLVLIDTTEGRALKRTSRETTGASELLSEARAATVVLLQPLLSGRRGYLRVAVNVPNATVIIDDERRSEGAGQVIPLAAGPHVLRVIQDGFYGASADVFVRPGHITLESVRLIPARETIEAYESTARLMRIGAYTSSAVAIGAGVLAALFYRKASEDKERVDRYASALDATRAAGDVGTYEEARAADDRFQTHQSLYLVGLGTAVVAGAASLSLWIFGDDPDRYAEFRNVIR